jgi:hypothetical protein
MIFFIPPTLAAKNATHNGHKNHNELYPEAGSTKFRTFMHRRNFVCEVLYVRTMKKFEDMFQEALQWKRACRLELGTSRCNPISDEQVRIWL